MDPLRIFIGWDAKEPIAFEVCAHSLVRHASRPVSIIPLVRGHLAGVLTRERGPLESTDFAFSRFLVPYLSGYEGVSIFMDSDMLVQADIYQVIEYLYAIADFENQGLPAVSVCQHDYTPRPEAKFLGQPQTAYPRKNWSSFILFDNARCEALTPAYVNTATGLELHRFQWIGDEEIGALPLEWNWLVGEYPPNPDAKILHFTRGTPCFAEFRACDHADRWWAEYQRMNAPIEEWIKDCYPLPEVAR